MRNYPTMTLLICFLGNHPKNSETADFHQAISNKRMLNREDRILMFLAYGLSGIRPCNFNTLLFWQMQEKNQILD